MGRSLFCLGLLIRYGSTLLSGLNDGVDIVSSLSLFKKYLLADDFGIKVRALQVRDLFSSFVRQLYDEYAYTGGGNTLQALGFVLIARPEYMLEKDVGKILAATLSSSCDARLKVSAYRLSLPVPRFFWYVLCFNMLM